MPHAGSLVILAVPGRGQDERVWGGLASGLGKRYGIALLAGAADLANRTGDVILAVSDAAPAAVEAARRDRIRAVILLAPLAAELVPELGLDPRSWADELVEYRQLAEQVRTITDPEERRSVVADGLSRAMGKELPAADVGRLRDMLRDTVDVSLNPSGQGAWSGPYADELRTLTIPVLVLEAGRDERAAAMGGALARRAPRGELVLLDTAQRSFPWLAQPDAALAAVTRFLEEI
jgi:pimeloyl-ACP methyl ester carboxylesterase